MRILRFNLDDANGRLRGDGKAMKAGCGDALDLLRAVAAKDEHVAQLFNVERNAISLIAYDTPNTHSAVLVRRGEMGHQLNWQWRILQLEANEKRKRDHGGRKGIDVAHSLL